MNRFLCMTLFACTALTQPAFAQMTLDQLVERAGIIESDTPVRDSERWSGAKKIVVRAGALDAAAATRAYPTIEFVSVSSQAQALRETQDADAFIGNCDAAVIAAARQLVWVQRTGSGVETCIDIPDIANGNIILSNMQKMESPIIAEHAIAMMMSLARNLPSLARAMDTGSWRRGSDTRSKMTSIVNKKLLVVGLGGIGTEVARLGAALGMQVTATRNSSRTGPPFVSYVGLSNELHKLAAESDVIISALPLTGATTNLFDAEFFSILKPSAIFINVGRGKSVVTDDLVAALRSGKLAGAGLDVTEPEPLPSSHPLWTLHNVIITPHVSSGGSDRHRRNLLMQENLRRFVAGDALLNVVDLTRGY